MRVGTRDNHRVPAFGTHHRAQSLDSVGINIHMDNLSNKYSIFADYENRQHRLGRETAAPGTDGGHHRRLVPHALQGAGRRYGLYRIHTLRRAHPRRFQGSGQTAHLGLRGPGGNTDLWAHTRIYGRGGEDGRQGRRNCRRPRRGHHRHQLRLPGHQDSGPRGGLGNDALPRQDGRHHQGGGRGRGQTGDSQDPPGLGRQFQDNSRAGRTPAGCGHQRTHRARPHPLPDVQGRGRLDSHRGNQAQPPDAHPHHRQR